MTRSIFAGGTDYRHQSFNDIVSDLLKWIESLKEVQLILQETLLELQKVGYWDEVPVNFQSTLGYAMKFFDTSIDEISKILADFNTEVRKDHSTRIRRLGEVGAELNSNFGIVWHQQYPYKEYKRVEFKLVEKLYQQGRGMAVDMIDLSNVAERLEDFVGQKYTIPGEPHKIITRDFLAGAGEQGSVVGDDTYQEILQVIHNTGKMFERLPSTYANKNEEALRDHLIMLLEPIVKGSTTGETFNKSGKTDILVRRDKSNIFVAECEWWNGPKKHSEKIDQLLSYLTWRDSKTAIVCFVGRIAFSSTLKKIVRVTQQHSCYIQYIGTEDETWHDFEFHLPGDPQRQIRMCVLAFHLPKAR